MYKFGVDVGGTTVKIGLFSGDGKLEEKYEIATDKSDQGAHIIEHIAAKLDEIIAEKSYGILDCMGVGIGLPGPVDRGMILGCVNLGWGIFSVADEVTRLTGVQKVKVGNDANVAALGEQWKGGGRGFNSIVMVTLGTGVGGGIVMNGKIVTGSHGAAGEIGHLTVNLHETRVCGCGKRGCLEQYSSATAIMRSAREKVANTDTPSLLRDYPEITGKEIFDAYKAGDDMAEDVVNEFAEYLGLGLAHTAQVIDPEAFVIGGGVSKNGQVVADITKEKYEKNVMFALKDKEFRLAELGNDAGMYGAVRMVLVD